MSSTQLAGILTESKSINSVFLKREVKLDFFLPKAIVAPDKMSLLLINDGQNMQELGLEGILNELYSAKKINALVCVGIHASPMRKMEYGVAGQTDYEGRGANAGAYSSFILQELLPFIYGNYKLSSFREHVFAGFSLGGLTALDITWNHPDVFSKSGSFSGSFWWRSVDQSDEAYDDDRHRIMQQVIRNGHYYPGLKFFFQCGNMDEVLDRNNNGIIDSIDDTHDIIRELVAKGYRRDEDIYYLEMPDGRHDVATWARAMPVFLEWAFGNPDAMHE